MLVFVDTSIIHTDPYLQSPEVRLLISRSSFNKYNIVIPKVVLDELSYNTAFAVWQSRNQIRKLEKDLSRLSLRDTFKYQPILDFEKQLKSNQTSLLANFKEVGINIVDYPDVNVEEMISQELRSSPPFKKGKSGYRDYFIWKTILSTINNDIDKFIILSKNHKDFGSGPSLLPNFQSDLDNLDTKVPGVVYNTISDFFTSEFPKYKVKHSFDSPGEKQTMLGNLSIRNWINDELIYIIDDSDLHAVFLNIDSIFSSISISKLKEIERYDILDILDEDGTDATIEVEIKLLVKISMDIKGSDYNDNESVRDFVGDFTEPITDDEVFWSYQDERMTINALISFDRETGKVCTSEIKSIDTSYGSIEL